MTDVTPPPEKQIEQLQPKVEGAAEANARLASTKDASPGAMPIDKSGDSEKLKLSTTDKDVGGMAESKISAAKDVTLTKDTHHASQWQYGPLDSGTNAQYNKASDTITVNERYQGVTEPALIDPLLAHESVHAQYKSNDPTDEASLQKYTDEELGAHRAQLDSWQQSKAEFDQKYPTDNIRQQQLSEEARDLLSDHLQLEQTVQEKGWSGFRQELEGKYRQRMNERLAGGS
jgi:hypothetical protein